MSGQNAFIGSCEIGEPFEFAYAPRNEDGQDNPLFVPEYYDVYTTSTVPSMMILHASLQDVALKTLSFYEAGGRIRYASIDTSNHFVAGQNYVLVLKEREGVSDTSDVNGYVMFNFRVDHPIARRTEWLRNSIENSVAPRLKRLLALSGENLVLDKYTYDTPGNITGMRIRIFDDAASAAASTIDLADSSLPEPGEVESHYVVTQTHDLPQNTRQSHISSPDADFDDATMNSNQESDHTPAPGNAAGEITEIWET